jgi:hypothetical protein
MPMCVQSSEFNITVQSGNDILSVEVVNSKKRHDHHVQHSSTPGCDLSSYNSQEM